MVNDTDVIAIALVVNVGASGVVRNSRDGCENDAVG